MLSLLRKFLSVNAALKIFKAMVLPYMEYIFFCLGPCNDKDLTRLQRLQNHGLRICLRAPPRTSVLQLHSSAKLLLVKNKIKLNILKQMHIELFIVQNVYIKDLWIMLIDILEPCLDQCLLIYSPKVFVFRSLAVWVSACGTNYLRILEGLLRRINSPTS